VCTPCLSERMFLHARAFVAVWPVYYVHNLGTCHLRANFSYPPLTQHCIFRSLLSSCSKQWNVIYSLNKYQVVCTTNSISYQRIYDINCIYKVSSRILLACGTKPTFSTPETEYNSDVKHSPRGQIRPSVLRVWRWKQMQTTYINDT
jgi:hypothetical protein